MARSRQKSNVPIISCPTCKKEFKKWYYVQYHQKTCSTGTTVFKCDLCMQEGFANSITLKNHIRSKHSDERPFACEHCPLRFATSMALSGHRVRKHNLNKAGEFVPKKMFPCGLCGKLLTTRTKLAQHVKNIHGNVKEFQCRYCEKKFTSKSNMKIHEGSFHTGLLPYTCPTCGLGFARKSALNQHRETLHALDKGIESIDAASLVEDAFSEEALLEAAVREVTRNEASTHADPTPFVVVEEQEVMDLIGQ